MASNIYDPSDLRITLILGYGRNIPDFYNLSMYIHLKDITEAQIAAHEEENVHLWLRSNQRLALVGAGQKREINETNICC